MSHTRDKLSTINNFTLFKVFCFCDQKRSELAFTTKGVKLFNPQDQKRVKAYNCDPTGPTNLERSHCKTVHSVENRSNIP